MGLSGNEVKMEIPQEIITSIVKAQVIAALGKSDDLVKAVIEAAITQKSNSYNRTTIFEEQVMEMIRKVAQECFQEWLTENRERIRSEMRKQLTAQKGRLMTELVDGFTKQLSSVYANVALHFPGEGH